MTQHTELIARLRNSVEAPYTCNAAANAIEALEAERDSLAHHLNRQKQWKDAMRDKMKELEREVEHWKSKYAVSIELRNGQASNVAQALAERNALQAQLAAAQGQEPVGYLLPTTGNFVHAGTVMAGHAGANWIKLYSTPIPQQPAEPALFGKELTKQASAALADASNRSFALAKQMAESRASAIAAAKQAQPVPKDFQELAKVCASMYASPHHITFTTDGLKRFIAAQQAQPEPVAYRFTHNEGNGKTRFTYHDETPENHHRIAYKDTCLKIEPLHLIKQGGPA